ncbi:UNVERIFIED_CONTAM: hypothetical protein Sangu_2783100 [Sesamum angustifolium]|uniref:DUF4283 domain-containing protein n=1 Tax=Sesamum angustifolium TaxID=2727405 RepID=A0AAW2IT44_9LAMI
MQKCSLILILSALSHTIHTLNLHTTHTEILTTHAEHPDGENKVPEADFLGEDDGKDSPSTREEFDFDAFYELANRVLTGDSDAMASLNSLKDRWEQHFKTSKNPALKSVLGRPSTPFRPRVSLLPRRCVRTDPNPALNPPATVQESDIYIGNVKLQAEFVDTIAGAFLQSSRKTLHFVPPTRQNGEVIIRPTKEVIDNGSKKWRSTAVGYFLGKRPYFPQVESFVRSNWKGLQHVSVSSSGFFFFRFFRRLDMEDVIEGGPWLFQDEGLSTVASGVGTPLYTDSITKDCSRLDFARVCVLIDFNSALPKHLVVISPVLRNGKEDPKRIDVEYEWLPQRCKNCCSLGHVSATCPANMKKTVAPPITIFVQKQPPRKDLTPPELKLTEGPRPEPSSGLASVSEQSTVPQLAARWCANSGSAGLDKGKDIVLHNSYSALDTELTKEAEATEFMGPNESSPMLGDL